MRVGYARADITPPIGVTLSGFAARCDKPLLGKGNFCCYSGRCKCDKADADCAWRVPLRSQSRGVIITPKMTVFWGTPDGGQPS